MAEFINTSDSIGEEELQDRIIQRTLTEICDDRVAQLKENALRECRKLTKAHFPNAKTIGANAFSQCESLADTYFPEVTKIGANCFFVCAKSLVKLDFSKLRTIEGANNFQFCYFLTALILRNTEQVCTLGNSNAFQNTPIVGYQGRTGYIYVPKALLEDYKAATNWSTHAARFRALEDYTVDGTTTGELDETKI